MRISVELTLDRLTSALKGLAQDIADDLETRSRRETRRPERQTLEDDDELRRR
jgi:hypothetical protein